MTYCNARVHFFHTTMHIYVLSEQAHYQKEKDTHTHFVALSLRLTNNKEGKQRVGLPFSSHSHLTRRERRSVIALTRSALDLIEQIKSMVFLLRQRTLACLPIIVVLPVSRERAISGVRTRTTINVARCHSFPSSCSDGSSSNNNN